MINFYISIENAFNENSNSALLIKISNKFIEMNIYLAEKEISDFKKFLGNDVPSIRAGSSAQSSVYWVREEDTVYILGSDEDSWDISLTADANLLKKIEQTMNTV